MDILGPKGKKLSLADGELAWTSFNRALRVFEFHALNSLAD